MRQRRSAQRGAIVIEEPSAESPGSVRQVLGRGSHAGRRVRARVAGGAGCSPRSAGGCGRWLQRAAAAGGPGGPLAGGDRWGWRALGGVAGAVGFGGGGGLGVEAGPGG